MESTLNKWLEELEEEAEIVSSNEINEEAHSNMIAFGFNEETLEEWGREAVSEFLHGCADLYRRKSQGLRMVFYSWFDEQAGQIRISAVSHKFGKLPFGCELNFVSLDHLINGFFVNDSGLYTNGALDVWQENI